MIIWAPRGGAGTLRPDIVVTRIIDGEEVVILILDLKTGQARIKGRWRESMRSILEGAGMYMEEMIRPIRPTNPNRVGSYITLEAGFPWD